MKTKRRTVCQTCRTRRLGCDGMRPACSQCVFSGRECDGYQLNLVFIQHTAAKRGKKRPHSCSTESDEQAIMKPPESCRNNRELSGKDISQYQHAFPQDPFSSTTIEFTSVITNSFLPQYMHDVSITDSSAISVCASWVKVLPEIVSGHQIPSFLRSAIKFFALMIADAGPSCRSISYKSFEAYGTSLQQLKLAMLKSQSFSLELGAAILCLAISELTMGNSIEGFLSHASGFSALIEFCPPEWFTFNTFHFIYVGCRPILLFKAIMQRRSTFLAQEEWVTKPFEAYPPAAMQQFISEMAILPAILEEIDASKHLDQDEAIIKSQELDSNLQVVIDRLEILKSRFADDILERQVSNEGKSIFYADLLAANILSHIRSFEIICLMERVQLKRRMSTENHESSCQPWPESVRSRIHMLATDVCRTLTYMLKDEMGLYGPVSALFPLKIANSALRQCGPTPVEVNERFQKLIAILDRRGFPAEKHFS
ncbi:hypothetical protein EJ04DRAFT_62686 [Polyplosphaeria fusca]|uniref:Zn(2)-C6 fungal-type domain-containing protein n=1 Tax=Polyplosphaeria fusca TaxID=682080 RepID=A0A9P4R7X0_9PLEO|nr:hypothetical protein EJ04DRAFT_62686 [Polyplosphaeria fusca]